MSAVHVVDDDPQVVALFVTVLRGMELPHATYLSGEEFLAEATSETAGCVLLDVMLPGLDGVQVIEALGARDIHLPVIAVSGYATVPLAVRAMRAGAFDTLQKPCPVGELRASVLAALEVDRTQRDRGQQRRDAANRLATLSPDERALLELLMSGVPNRVAARKLAVSTRTIERRRAALVEKLGVQTLVEASSLVALAGVPLRGVTGNPVLG